MAQLRCAKTSELLLEGTPTEVAAMAEKIGYDEVLFDGVGWQHEVGQDEGVPPLEHGPHYSDQDRGAEHEQAEGDDPRAAKPGQSNFDPKALLELKRQDLEGRELTAGGQGLDGLDKATAKEIRAAAKKNAQTLRGRLEPDATAVRQAKDRMKRARDRVKRARQK